MRITTVRTRIIELDATARYGGRPVPAGRSAVYRYPIVELGSDSGVVGRSMGYTPHGDADAVASIIHEVFAGDLLGLDPTMVEAAWQRLHRRSRHLYNLSDGIVGTLDVALWDLAGRIAGMPIARMLGQFRPSIPAYQTSWLTDPDEQGIAEEVLRAQAAGYHGYKLQLRDGPARDLPRLAAARSTAGPDFPLMHDAVAGYSLTDAIRVGRVLDELSYTWFEEPLADRQLSRLRQLTESVGVPTLAGESVTLDELSELLQSGAARIIRGDVLLKAGISGLFRAVRASELLGYELEIHAANSPLLDIANLHVAAAARNSRWIEVHHPVFRFGIVGDPLTPDARGMVAVPDGPGLGVELDEDWIDDRTVAVRETTAP